MNYTLHQIFTKQFDCSELIFLSQNSPKFTGYFVTDDVAFASHISLGWKCIGLLPRPAVSESIYEWWPNYCKWVLIFVSVRVDSVKKQYSLNQLILKYLSALKQYTPTPTQELMTGNEEGFSQLYLSGNAGEEYCCWNEIFAKFNTFSSVEKPFSS